MTRNNSFVDIFYMVNQISDFFSILMRQTIASRVRYINNCCPCFDHGFDYLCQISIFGTPCIFCIKLNILPQDSLPILRPEPLFL